MKLKIAFTILLALVIFFNGYGQENSKRKVVVTGKVVNQEGIPVSDVMIFLDGKNSKVKTDIEGKFKLKFKPTVDKLAFYSFQEGGFEMDYTGLDELSIIIKQDFETKTLVVSEDGNSVETGYFTIKKNDITGSISSIRSERFENNTYNTIYDMIAGEVPGVQVVGNSIVIRGPSSFNMSNQPLFVVNGTPVSSINHISPNTVESIDILKGPSTAMYGSRGTNGVIVITLKGSRK